MNLSENRFDWEKVCDSLKVLEKQTTPETLVAYANLLALLDAELARSLAEKVHDPVRESRWSQLTMQACTLADKIHQSLHEESERKLSFPPCSQN